MAKQETTDINALMERIKALEDENKRIQEQPTKVPVNKNIQKSENWLSEKVRVKLFKDGDKYKDDVFVGINGKGILIKRGEEVEVERKYALLIDQSQIQTIKSNEYMEKEQKRFADENK